MPTPIPHQCNYPGCGARTIERFCPLHKTLAAREYNQYRRSPDSNKTYGRRWRKIRDLYIAKHPLCELCLAAGFHAPAEQVHHKLPIDQGGTHADENLQALCGSCHSRITITETNRRR
jgi:5-methylcytosine-specific restriction protein A